MEKTNRRFTGTLLSNVKKEMVHPGVYILGGMGNITVIETDIGFVLIDAGRTQEMAEALRNEIRSISDAPIHSIVYSHGHNGYNAAAWYFREAAKADGEPEPRFVAHENVSLRYRRYEETWQFQRYLNSNQFRIPLEALKALKKPQYTYPTVTFSDKLRLIMGDRIVEVLSAPSETDDSVAVWLPEEKLLYTGPSMVSSCINIGTPLRTQRDDARWVNTLEKLVALQPEILIPNFGNVLRGREEIQHILTNMADGLKYLRREVVDRLNKGMNDVEILYDIEYPAEYFEQPWSNPTYGCPDMIVRDIYRSETGWWDRNPTSLHPDHPRDAASAILSAISDRKTVIDMARNLMEEGKVQTALHVIDILALAPDDDEDVKEAKKLKSKLLHLRSENLPSVVSQKLYLSHADSLDKEVGE